MFLQAFTVSLVAMLQIGLIALIAGVLVRRKIVLDSHIHGLSATTVNVLLPSMIFANLLQKFDPHEFVYWPILPLSAAAMTVLGLLIAALLFARELPAKKDMLAPAGIQNAAYLVLPLGKLLYPDQFDLFAMYNFLYVLAYNPILWSVGKFLISSKPEEKVTIGKLLPPPFVANVSTLLIIFLGLKRFIPAFLIESIDMLGAATVPIATFVLGAMLATASLNVSRWLSDAVRVISVKFLIIPLIITGFLYLIRADSLNPLMASMLVLQAASAPATGLMLQVKYYGGDVNKVSSIVLWCYIVCIFAIPFWFGLWQMISG